MNFSQKEGKIREISHYLIMSETHTILFKTSHRAKKQLTDVFSFLQTLYHAHVRWCSLPTFENQSRAVTAARCQIWGLRHSESSETLKTQSLSCSHNHINILMKEIQITINHSSTEASHRIPASIWDTGAFNGLCSNWYQGGTKYLFYCMLIIWEWFKTWRHTHSACAGNCFIKLMVQLVQGQPNRKKAVMLKTSWRNLFKLTRLTINRLVSLRTWRDLWTKTKTGWTWSSDPQAALH